MATTRLKLNRFTVIKLNSIVNQTVLDKLAEFKDDSYSDDDNSFLKKYRYSFTEQIVDEVPSKKNELNFWINEKYAISFGDKRSILMETINLLNNVLDYKCERMFFEHNFLVNLIHNHRFTHNLIGVKMESQDTGFIKSISIDGDNLSVSPEFSNYLNTGNKLSKVILDIESDNDETFVATIYNSGHILLSPYVKAKGVIYFIKELIEELG